MGNLLQNENEGDINDMTETELVMKIQRLDRAIFDIDELLRYLAQSSQPVKAQCAGCEGWFHSLIVGGDSVGRCVKCNQNQEML